MALLQDLIRQIDDPELRDRILQETNKLLKQKKFGLVFEEHLPECTPLYDMPIRIGSKVALKTGYVSDIYTVIKIDADDVLCDCRETHEQKTFKLDELVTVAEFGEPIYPTLKLIDTVDNAPDSDLWHTLIEADNYHALQLLEYLYSEKVDCIYIDPPYNTGAKDWKYNNDYVDSTDTYRHSKWLSFMEKRLKIAKKLLNPADSVLIVTIDEKEYLHLGCLLEEMFPEANMQMISITMNHAGTGRQTDFARVNEYAFYIFFGNAVVLPEYEYGEKHESVLWDVFRRSELSNQRIKTKTQFYPIFINDKTGKIDSVGDPIPLETRVSEVVPPVGCTAVFPIRDDGIETMWSCKKEELLRRIEKGYIRIGKKDLSKHQKYSLSYIKAGAIQDIESGKAQIEGYAKDGSVQAFYKEKKKKNPPTVIESPLYDARIHGSGIIDKIIGQERFSYPKSLYAVRDCLNFVIANKQNALVVDFFAGSGTTLHAVNLLNAKDGGHRRCIMVTNNEVSVDEAKSLSEVGYHPGDEEWEKLGIARYVTWPRTVCSIKGHDIAGKPLKGNYIGSDIPLSDGFKTNAAFFKLGFLDKTSVALGRQLKELLPVLWMKGGAIGKCPSLESDAIPEFLILPLNKMAILIDEIYYSEFDAELSQHPEIQTIFIITDSETAYRSMIRTYNGKDCYQLYRDYLDNFRINMGR